ncbi:FAD-binding domain-containing protein [Colletotrichum zoysiae]|uniref:FAD-binding domain-containing protein n=1 Tax=Colletotrichum zoysiae TaxID=1216348 RepID=A0AAD9LVS7_9PEZI|nr:FAD-binding domain-containing protein [Colletotrichum zoysiae]
MPPAASLSVVALTGLALVPVALAAGATLECSNPSQLITKLDDLFSSTSAIGCSGSQLQKDNAGGYWGEQYAKNASIVVYPSTAKDVQDAVSAFVSSEKGGKTELAFGSGFHGMTGAAATDGYMIDLKYLNKTELVYKEAFDGSIPAETVITYEGGARWGDVLKTTNGTGYTVVGARDSTVGVGGFSTGGGIGFLAGAYGFSGDRLLAMDVVLMDGTLVTATKANKYADLFWAIQGGGGQFGIVTKFYQKAALEPKLSHFHLWVVANESETQAQENTATFFESNTDPFTLMYYGYGYLPADIQNPTRDLAGRTVLIGVQFGNPADDAKQPGFHEVFNNQTLLKGVKTLSDVDYDLPYANAFEVINQFFPYGLRRGFWGPQTTKVTSGLLQDTKTIVKDWLDSLLATGEKPLTSLWAVQYMYPGLNGNLPAKSEDTAWPHTVAGHQTLFSPGWALPKNDKQTLETNTKINNLIYDHQSKVGPFLADYPNYISPDSEGHRVWGDNVQRLIDIKEKYDPDCIIAQGRVFASAGCTKRGKANIFAKSGSGPKMKYKRRQ